MIVKKRLPSGPTAQNEVKLRMLTFFAQYYPLTNKVSSSGVQRNIKIYLNKPARSSCKLV